MPCSAGIVKEATLNDHAPHRQRRIRHAVIMVAIVAAILTGLSPFASAVQPVAAAGTMVDDSSSQLTWTGYWNRQQDTRFLGGTEQVNGGTGASARLTFTGTTVAFVYSTGPDRARAGVTIDNVARPLVDQYGQRAFQQSTVYTLAPGQHTIIVRNSGGRTSGSTGWDIALDALIVDGGGATPTATQPARTPSPTATATATAVPPVSATATATATPGSTSSGNVAPVAGQQCPAWVHDQYVATGPDGKSYPTWHPPTDPTYKCWFGHEHGDDPTGSPALRGRPVLFGYVGSLAGDSEPHVGFKVFRWDNIQHPNAPNHSGASLLMAVHQGTGGAARFTTVNHSVVFNYYNPTDGREVHVQMMAPFGKLLVGCGANDPDMVLSQQQQADATGARQVAADKCFNAPNIPYEDWITALYVGSDANGNWRAYLDPHFAIFNPNTYCIVSSGACSVGYSDVRAGTKADPVGVGSWFKGDHREAYLNQVWLDNAGNSSTVWTDPFGRLAAPNAPGALAQFIANMDARPLGNSAAFDSTTVYDDGTVHAPN
jgi:hypothetical protein